MALRVLITVPCQALPGGVANYYRALRPLLDEQKVYFEIGARPGEAGAWAGVRRLVADFWRFHRALALGSVDLVHINPSLNMRSVIRDGLLLLIAKAHHRPVLVFFRGWERDFEARIRTRYAGLFRLVYGRADAFVVLAEQFRRSLEALGLRAPVTLETTVVADAVFAEHPDYAAGGKRDPAACEILYLSRLDRKKGIAEAIGAVAWLVARFPSVRLTIAGDGPERAGAETLAHKLGTDCISFAGHLDDEARWHAYRRADIFLFPAVDEGMPNTVLEAMAFGLPIVTRPVGGIRDFFENERMGYITESQDPAVFGMLLAHLVENPALRASVGRYNRDYARRRFAATVVAARLLEIYDQVGRQAAAR